ncbi:MAG: cytochrome c [Actinobacteria bacterium]|nr:cytochrome c [Actinomycetota bacterium]
MSNRNAFLVFLAGTLASLVLFLALTWDTHQQVAALTNADKLSEQVVAGKRVFEKKNCNECHTILGFGVYYAPDLTRAYARIGAEGIKTVVLHPETVFANSFRKMPNLGLTEQEATDLVAFLEWTNNIDNHDWPPQDRKYTQSPDQRRLQGAGLSPGAAAFKAQCMGCHSIGGQGGSIGPALDQVGAKYDAATIAAYIAAPTTINPNAKMPPQTNVSEADRQAIGEFLAKQK